MLNYTDLISKDVSYIIHPSSSSELIETPNGLKAKLAYSTLYSPTMEDLEIELERISFYESKLDFYRLPQPSSHTPELIRLIKAINFHYKRAISILSPEIAAGWNRWSESILWSFNTPKMNTVVWGSGNCGKSVIFAILLYIKWRIAPTKRMVVIASSVVQESGARVMGYIKNIHTKAPESKIYRFNIYNTQDKNGIYTMLQDSNTNKLIADERACIVNLPVKVNAKRGEVGSNLLGKHPKDRLILGFDEAQEHPSKLLEEKVFLNWYTNSNVELKFWGNPSPVDYVRPDTWDMLFKAGASSLSQHTLKDLEAKSHSTLWWENGKDTQVLHLSMLDSPKDDLIETNNMLTREDGLKQHRLHFLAGLDNVKTIKEKISEQSPSWYSQVLGFPYIDHTGEKGKGCLTPLIVRECNSYPLTWYTPQNQMQWFMGVDASGTGKYDECALVVAKAGLMFDGRWGIDFMHGKYCKVVKLLDNEEFIDTCITTIYELSQSLQIPLNNISIEAHGSSEVLRYGLQKKIHEGLWAQDRKKNLSYHIVNPTQSTTDRLLFKVLGHMLPADEVVADFSTELWYAVRCAVLSKQLFNLPDKVLQQFYNRTLDTTSSGVKFRLESKKDLLKRGIKSPNDADAVCNLVELLRLRGFKYAFNVTGAYHKKFMYDHATAQNLKQTSRAMNIVSSMFNLSNNTNQKQPIKWGL